VVRDVPAAALTAFARSEERINVLQHGFELHLQRHEGVVFTNPRHRLQLGIGRDGSFMRTT